MELLQKLGPHSLAIRLKRLSDYLAWESTRLYKKLGNDIEANWMYVFRLLQQQEKMSIMEMAEALNLKHPSVLLIVNRMMKKGYLKQAEHVTDKRKRVISLTAKGVKKISEVEPVWKSGRDVIEGIIAKTGYPVIAMLESLEQELNEKGFYTQIMEELDAQSKRHKKK